jgi:hypothetical protein
MRNMLGLALIPFVVVLFWQAYQHWQNVEAAWAAMPPGTDRNADEDADPHSLAGFGEMALPFVLTALVIAGLECIVAYRMADGGRVLSIFDMGMAMLALVAYGTNFTVKIKLRKPKLALQKAPAAASLRA